MRSSVPIVALVACGSSTHATSGAFDKQTLDTQFRAEAAAVFDVDHDGHLDIVTDQYWYAGPDFAPHEIRTPETFDAAGAYSKCFAAFGDDLSGDGWTDLVVVPKPHDPAYAAQPVLWYENPHDHDAHWTPHTIADATAVETAIYVDLFGEGRRVLVMGRDPPLALSWFEPSGDPGAAWTSHDVSASGFAGAGHYVHGLGAGDVDGDGRTDVLTGYGWFEQTADRDTWRFHDVPFGPDACSTMFTYDFDGDGLADVVCASPHGYGVHWLQQQPGGAFVDHLIDDTLSQTHAVRLEDLDGDGFPEIVSGKRYWAHGPSGDPGVSDPALVVAWSFRRDGSGGVAWSRTTIDDDSGVGTAVSIADVDGDGKKDVVTSNKKGLFFFRQR